MQQNCSIHDLAGLTVCFHKDCDQIPLCLICYHNHTKTHIPHIIEISLLGSPQDQGQEIWLENFELIKNTMRCSVKERMRKGFRKLKMVQSLKIS